MEISKLNVDLYRVLHYKTSHALFTLVETEQDCLKKLPVVISSSGKVFQTVGLAIEKVQQALLVMGCPVSE